MYDELIVHFTALNEKGSPMQMQAFLRRFKNELLILGACIFSWFGIVQFALWIFLIIFIGFLSVMLLMLKFEDLNNFITASIYNDLEEYQAQSNTDLLIRSSILFASALVCNYSNAENLSYVFGFTIILQIYVIKKRA